MPLRLTLVVAILSLTATAALAQSADPSGLWLTEAGDAHVRISKCGGGICGSIAGLRDAINKATGRPPVDDKNPNPALRTRPMIGLRLFSGMQPAGPNKWAGRIYNADDGGTYASDITLTSAATLRVQGCIGAFCGGENWTRTGAKR